MAQRKESRKTPGAEGAPTLLLRNSIAADTMEEFDRSVTESGWELALSGHWYDSPYHSGHIAYYVRELRPGIWLLKSLERNAILDDVTEEDVEAGALNDDQLQAMWGMTLEEAQNESFEEIAAAWTNAPTGTTSKEAAKRLYQVVCLEGGKEIDEPSDFGLLAE